MYGVGVCDRFSFVGDSQKSAFFRMKFHFVVGLPLLQCVEVCLENLGVGGVCDCSV